MGAILREAATVALFGGGLAAIVAAYHYLLHTRKARQAAPEPSALTEAVGTNAVIAWGLFVLVVLGVVAVVVLVFAGSASPPMPVPTIESCGLARGPAGTWQATGTVVNVFPATHSFRIEIRLLAPDGSLVSQAYGYVNDVDAGQKAHWQVEGVGAAQQIDQCRSRATFR
jgi:hypothetical protein